jgi:YVTN family beta-propeller protein
VATTLPEPGSPAVEPTATIPIGEHVDGGLVTKDAVWAVVTADQILYRIDPVTNSVVQQIPAPGIGFRFDIGHDAAWVPDFERSVVRRVALDSGAVLAEIPTGLNPDGISVTDTAVWVANHRAGTVTRIDPTTNEVVATIEVGPAGPSGPQAILASDERVWVGVPNLAQVVVIDATTNTVVASIDSTATCEMRLLGESVWVTNCIDSDDVAVIDVHGTESRGLHAGGPTGTPLQVDGDVWLPTISLGEPIGHLVRVDPATVEILDSVPTDPPAFIMGTGFGSLWNFSWDTGAVIRLPIDALTPPAG